MDRNEEKNDLEKIESTASCRTACDSLLEFHIFSSYYFLIINDFDNFVQLLEFTL